MKALTLIRFVKTLRSAGFEIAGTSERCPGCGKWRGYYVRGGEALCIRCPYENLYPDTAVLLGLSDGAR